ncbi:MAG: hypothetical protein M3Y86_00455 [Verrucomicrobiota bacterium]|nr:hypothetical protein [Verrucomicrobiota bacterium]
MKWLAAGLTFVNLSTVAAFFLALVAGGLGHTTAALALSVGFVTALFAFHQTAVTAPGVPNEKSGRHLVNRACFWLVAAFFAFFAFRSFGWLLYIDGNELRIQSINNLGDLCLHITYIRNFASGVPFWPENPIYFLSHIRYPAGTDLFNALLLLSGLDLRHGLIWTALIASIATFFALYRWGGTFTVAGFLFNGGLVGFQILQTGKMLDYQGDKTIAWKNLALSMFVTQRGLLYALPAGLLLLYQWRLKHTRLEGAPPAPLPFWLEVTLYASMPFFHIHTFLALSLVAAFLFLVGDNASRRSLAWLVGISFLPATYFVWTITDHFQARSLLAWSPGWVQTDSDFKMPFLQFWLLNFGLLPFFVLALVGFVIWRAKKQDKLSFRANPVLAFLTPAALLFLFACLVKTAPWAWDNIKLIIWAYLIMLPFLWRELIVHFALPVRAAICFVLFASGAISLLGGLLDHKSGFVLAERADVDAVGGAVRKLPADARFAAFPTYNHPLLLQGRKLVLGYLGHVWTQGFDYGEANRELTALMEGAPNWRELARTLHARYLFWGTEEKANYPKSTRPWEKQAGLVASGNWGAIYDLEAGPQVAPGQ